MIRLKVFCTLVILSLAFAEHIPDELNDKIVDEKTNELQYDFDSLRPLHQNEKIVITKDNVIPILKTVVLAFTHKEDPTYQEVVKASGKQLLKFAEKYVGEDEYMQTLLRIVKKYVEEFRLEGVSEAEEDVLGELAEDYLRDHKFDFIFPESLLLHQPEMDQYLSKKKEVGGHRQGKQLQLDFEPFLERITEFANNIGQRLTDRFPRLNEIAAFANWDRIGTTIDEYLPALRTGPTLPNLGLSVGSLGILAATGAILSAVPFFFGFASTARKDDEDDLYYSDTGLYMPHQRPQHFMAPPPPINQHGHIIQPQWAERQDTQPHFENQQSREGVEPAPQQEFQENYDRNIEEYFQWAGHDPSSANEQGQTSQAQQDYYNRYRNWFKLYYNEQFGEDPPPSTAPNAYVENNIIGMYPPPQHDQHDRIQHVEENSEPEDISEYQPVEGFAPSQRQVTGEQNQQSNFQVFHVDERNRPIAAAQVQGHHPSQGFPPKRQIQTPVQQNVPVFDVKNAIEENIPRPEVVFSETNAPDNAQALPLFDNNNLAYLNRPAIQSHTNPRPVYRPPVTPASFPPTERGFKPLAGEEHTLNEEPKEQTAKVAVVEVKDEADVEDKEGFTQLKPSSIYENSNRESESPNTLNVPEKPTVEISPVTSGALKTPASTTAIPATTPQPYYYKKHPAFMKTVRVVTSKSVVTSEPFLKDAKESKKDEYRKRKKASLSLQELIRQQRNDEPVPQDEVELDNILEEEVEPQPEDIVKEIKEDKTFRKRKQNIDPLSTPNEVSANEPISSVIDTNEDGDMPIYALDPFYGPRLSRTDAIFHQLNLVAEGCREQVVCNMYKNPNAYTPLSDYLSRQLTVTLEDLKRPKYNDQRILRFYNYLQAARTGQDGFDCLQRFPNCPTDTTRLSYKPIVNAYNKVSALMNARGNV